MPNPKIQAARELIQEKQYAAARAVLKTIPNDPTAIKWLAKLDEIAPERSKRSPYLLPAVIIGVLLLAILGLTAAFLTRGNNATVAAPTSVAQVPTMIELPTETPTVPPSSTPLPTETPLPTVIAVIPTTVIATEPEPTLVTDTGGWIVSSDDLYSIKLVQAE